MKLLLENWRKFLQETERPGPGRTSSRYEQTAEPIAFDGFAKAVDAGGYGSPGGFLEENEETTVQRPQASKSETDEYNAPYEYEDTPEKSRETHFGKNPDNFQCIKDLRSQTIHANPMIFYRCMEDVGYTKLGAGSFRAVFDIPENPELVLKVVGPANAPSEQARSREMNKKEAKASFQTASDLVPKVYDSARDYFWIISEKVTPILTWEDMQEFFPLWSDEPPEDFKFWFQRLIDSKTIPEVAAKHIDKRAEYTMGYEERGEELVNDSLILDIRDLLAQFDLPPWDIRPYNVGYAIRGGQKQFVILDPGFELKKLFGQDGDEGRDKNERGISAIFDDDIAKTWNTPKNNGDTVPAKPNIMENWRRLIKESRGPKDFHYNIIHSTKKVVIRPLNLQTKELVPGKAEGNAEVVLEKRTDMPYWQLAWSNSPQGSEGVGTVLYLMALEIAGNEGLSPDDYEQSPDALRVWAKFMPENNRLGVSKQKKEEFLHDNDENPFFFVFFKGQNTTLNRFSNHMSYEVGEEEKKPVVGPKVEPFNIENDWESLYDDDILQEITKVMISVERPQKKEAMNQCDVLFKTKSKDIMVRASMATTPKETAQGLMFHKNRLGDRNGMLFVMPEEKNQAFHMKNTYIPLDMIFIDKNNKVVGTLEETKPFSPVPCQIGAPSSYVLEVDGGWCSRQGVQPGNIVQFLPLS